MISLGIAGKPNVGKSTFFKAATLAPAEVAPYPFTTISPNIGVAAVRVRCPCVETVVREGARLSAGEFCGSCVEGSRFIPVQLIDVAGLVKGAHEGRGLGNEFLDDLRRAEAIIQVVDVAGATDAEGNPVGVGEHDPVEDVISFEEELLLWVFGILKRNWRKILRKASLERIPVAKLIAEQLAGVGVSEAQVRTAISRSAVSEDVKDWDDEELRRIASQILRVSKRMVIAANKADIAPKENIRRLQDFIRRREREQQAGSESSKYDGSEEESVSVSGSESGREQEQERERMENGSTAVIPCSAEAELALRRAAEKGIVKYLPGDADFEIVGEVTAAQRRALERIREFMRENGGTGVQQVLNHAVFHLLSYVVVYPVEDEHKFSDSSGGILPDAFLLKRGSTARDLAFAVHTDIGKHFLFAIDARTKRRLGEKYELKNNDIIKIVHTQR